MEDFQAGALWPASYWPEPRHMAPITGKEAEKVTFLYSDYFN